MSKLDAMERKQMQDLRSLYDAQYTDILQLENKTMRQTEQLRTLHNVISRRKQVTRKLRQRNEELENLVKLADKFFRQEVSLETLQAAVANHFEARDRARRLR